MYSMISSLFSKYSKTFISKWTILFLDIILVSTLYPLAVVIRNNFELGEIDIKQTLLRSCIISAIYTISFLCFGSYKSIVRQTGLKDAFIVTKAALIGCISALVISLVSSNFLGIELLALSKGAVIIHFLISLFFLLGFRFLVKASFFRFRQMIRLPHSIPVIIFGSGELGGITRNSLEKEISKEYKLHSFIDDNVSKQGKRSDGVIIQSAEAALNKEYIDKHGIKQVIIAINNLQKERRKEIIEQCMALDVQVKIVPPVESWIQNDFAYQEIKPVAIEDLLGREPINLNNETISIELNEKCIMISGAAGSIGSEIARQVIYYRPSKVILVDQAESALYELQMELKRKCSGELFNLCEFVILDITRYQSLDELLGRIRPDIIYHSAAYKHVPLMEQFPEQAARVNIMGTRNLTDLACKYEVSKFVMVSTDKAINPTNVMGATKRAAEMYVQSKNIKGFYKTSFITTRFGNVLGSNGSVVPQFKKQIEEGGPVMVTHPDITRYFMTISEACNLVLEAGAIGCNSQILVFDMGQPIKIIDLATKMIRLMGLEPDKDIKIEFSGLRPGEKLVEELISSLEENLPTHHPKILISKTAAKNNLIVTEGISKIEKAIYSNSAWEVVKYLKLLVPEFVSNNSKYEILDQAPTNLIEDTGMKKVS